MGSLSPAKAKPAPLLTMHIRGPWPDTPIGRRYATLDLCIARQRYVCIAYHMDRGEWIAITTLVGLPNQTGTFGDASLHTDGRHAEDAARDILGRITFGPRA